jgi:cytochrome c biogenesis protein CcmG, thiol:disulfide interchange protein DsbE
MKKMRIGLLPAGLAALTLGWFLAAAAPASALLDGSKLKKGQPAPDFSLKDLDGKTWKLSDLKGKKIVMIDFWATWCNICKREMPILQKVYQEYQGKGVEFLGVALDENEAAIKKVVREKGVTYPTLVDKDTKVATEIYQLSGPIPYKVVIDLSGTIVYDHVGDYVDYPPEIVDVFDQLLEAQPAKKK